MELRPHISVEGVSFGYADKQVLDHINFGISHGEITTILGPNGCGKSTLIRLMLGFLHPAKGCVRVDGIEITGTVVKELARTIAYVSQLHKTAFPYSVEDVVLMGRIPHKSFFFKYSKGDLLIACEAMERLSLLHLAKRPYTEISGGERQLTIIARALAQGARTLIMDEPASGLDYGNQLKLLEEIARLSGEGFTIIKSTHSPEHALWISNHVIMIKNGHIFAEGKPDEIICNKNLYALYGAEVDIVKTDKHIKTCVPRSINIKPRLKT